MVSDAAVRAQALDPQRSFIVQAPAGSGKTELLTQRYLRLLALVDAPEKVLAITFTRKAAAEMRSRVLQALQDADGSQPESSHKRRTWELARAVRQADQRHEWHLARHAARLRIQTIDALNASLARRLPVLAGTGSALEPTDDPLPLYEAAGRQLIERLGDDSDLAAQLEVLIVHLGNRVDRIVGLLSDLLAKRDQWLHPVIRARASEDLRAILERTLDQVVSRHLWSLFKGLGVARCRDVLALLQFSGRNLLSTDSLTPARRELLEHCVAYSGPLDAGSATLKVWRAAADMLFTKESELYETVTIRQGFPKTLREPKERMLSLLKALKQEPQLVEELLEVRSLPNTTYSDDQWRLLEALLELLPAAVAELQLVFQAQGKADYVEVSLRALRALGTADEPTDLALAFDYRLEHVLVDEFQDTSFSQLDLLERLTAGWSDGDGRTLFCVGDPMQSIYRFRQAEVGLFIELQQQGLRNLRLEALRLEANFRSAPQIVDWVNQVFPGVLAARNDAEQGAVKYSPSTAASDREAGGYNVHAFVNENPTAEALQVVSVVREALERDADGRIAILVTARSHADAIARELSLARIDFQAVEIERLRERPVVQDLIALTRALVHLADRTAWLAVLRAPWCGLALADLHSLAVDPAQTIDESVLSALSFVPDDLFAEGRLSDDGRSRLARTHEVLQAALSERGRWPLRVWVERTWNALGGPATVQRREDLDDAEAFLQRLEEIESVGDLEDVARLEEQLQRLFANARAQGASRVEIMTIHAAKGLEFETVIVPGLQRFMPAQERELLRWTRIAGPDGGIVLAPIKAEGSDPDPIYRWIELLERQRVLRERARLLYVAVTRAKRDLHLLGTVKGTVHDVEVEIQEPRQGSMLRMLWSAVRQKFDEAAPSSAAQPAAGITPAQKIRRLPLQWNPPEPPVTMHTTPAPVIDLTAQQPVFDWVTQTSRHIGTLVHRELDRLCRPGADASTLSSPQVRARLLVELAELGVPPDRCATACDRVVAAIGRTLEDRRGRWVLGLDEDLREAASELALSGVIDGQILEGVIDRTFIDASGRRWIVDFKTSTHEGGGLEAFLDEEVVRYRSQLQRYARLVRLLHPAEPVHAALYFPLMRQWREVVVD